MRVGDDRRGTAGDTASVRISTDRADVDVDWLVAALSERASLMPATRDAHELYRQYAGFEPLGNPERVMECPHRP